MKLRQHKGGLEESMDTVIEIEPTLDALTAAIAESLKHWDVSVTPSMVHVEFYCEDKRIGWTTYIVTVDGYGVYGYTNGPIEGAPADTQGQSLTYQLFTQYHFGQDGWRRTPFFPLADTETADRDLAIAAADYFDADTDTNAVRLVAIDTSTGQEVGVVEGSGVDFNQIAGGLRPAFV